MKIYLDINKTIIKKDLSPANYLRDFLQQIIGKHQVYWFTTHCTQGDNTSVINYLSGLVDKDTLDLLKQVRSTKWQKNKTEVINFNDDFIILDDFLFDAEQNELKRRGKLNSWIKIDLDNNPNQLLDVLTLL